LKPPKKPVHGDFAERLVLFPQKYKNPAEPKKKFFNLLRFPQISLSLHPQSDNESNLTKTVW